jgi:hypothetical protein
MSIRESIQSKRWLSVLGAVLMIGFAVVVLAYNYLPEHRPTGEKACYSDDDGQSWFVDDTYKIVPFDHNGKQAVRAMVFLYAGGAKNFIVCLIRNTPDGQVALQKAIDQAKSHNQPITSILQFNDTSLQEVKLAGAGHPWVRRSSAEARQVLTLRSPDGSALDMLIP